MQLAPAPLIHQLLPQTLRVHLPPLRNGEKFAKVLEQHEKEKKDKYLQNCLEMRKNFMPMVYSVDGIAGREAES
jgi:hypothetical protein